MQRLTNALPQKILHYVQNDKGNMNDVVPNNDVFLYPAQATNTL